MNGIETSILLLVLLGACLVALILVLIARKEAAAVRESARSDVQTLRNETREQARETTRRHEHLEAAEKRLAAERERLDAQAEKLAGQTAEVERAQRTIAARRAQQERDFETQLQQLGGLTAAEAQSKVTEQIIAKAEHAANSRLHRLDRQVRIEADDHARRIITSALSRLAVETSAESTVTAVPLPSPSLKGPIIGKEGRNIRTFEALTGVNLIVDESDDHVLLSGFDARRREVARITLEQLMDDGRINPERIETMHARAIQDVDEQSRSSGHDAAESAGVSDLHPDLIHTLGALRLRTSYGQNIAAHLVESAQIAGVIAAELGADEALARRAALLHDVGKSLTANRTGTHAALGAELAARCGESPAVVNAIAAHHNEVPGETIEAVIVQIADAISASRPGARRDDVEQHVERMEAVEALVASRPGIAKVLAMGSGREIRVVVQPDQIGDTDLADLAQSLVRQVTATLDIPGEVRVTVVRELRATATSA